MSYFQLWSFVYLHSVLTGLEQATERARKEATGSGEHASPVKDTEEQRKVCHVLFWLNQNIAEY